MDYFIIAVTTIAGLAFHGWLIVRFRRWADRDLALSIAGGDPDKRSWMLQRLADSITPEPDFGQFAIDQPEQRAAPSRPLTIGRHIPRIR